MGGFEFAAQFRAATAYALASQARDGSWHGRSWARAFDTGLAGLLFRAAGLRRSFLRTHAFFRREPPPREEILPQPARRLGLHWEWLLNHSARSLSFEGEAKRGRSGESFLARLERAREPLPPIVATLYSCFVERGSLSWCQAPDSLRALVEEGYSPRKAGGSLSAEELSLAGARLSLAAFSSPRRVQPLIQRIRATQGTRGDWCGDPAITAFLGVVLARPAPASSLRAARWLAQRQNSKGGLAPSSSPRAETKELCESLRALPGARPAVERAERFLKRRAPSAAGPAHGTRFNAWFEAGELARTLSAQGGWALRDAEPMWDRVARSKNGDGGWSFCPGLPSNASSTASAVLALSLAGRWEAARSGGAWLARRQRKSGTWRFPPEFLGPRPVRFNRPLEAHARCLQALAALEKLSRERDSRAS